MTTKDEALKLALKRAFNLGQTYWQQVDSEYPSHWKKGDVTLASFNQLVEDTIREALADQAAQQQKPVAWMVDVDLANYQGQSEYRTILAWNAKPVWSGTHEINEVLKSVPLYTSPPPRKPWVGLTDVEWMNIVNKDHAWFGQRPEDVAHEVAKLVEAKLKEKNA